MTDRPKHNTKCSVERKVIFEFLCLLLIMRASVLVIRDLIKFQFIITDALYF